MAPSGLATPSSSQTAKEKKLATKWLGLDSGLCWRCGHQTYESECHFCGRSIREQLADFEDYDNPLGPGPSGANIQDLSLLDADAEPLNKRNPKKRDPEDDLSGDIISPRDRRRHIKERESLLRLQWKLLQDEKKRVSSGNKDPLVNFASYDIPSDPRKASKIPEFKPGQPAALQPDPDSEADEADQPTLKLTSLPPPFKPVYKLDPLDLKNLNDKTITLAQAAEALKNPFVPQYNIPPMEKPFTITQQTYHKATPTKPPPTASIAPQSQSTGDQSAPPFEPSTPDFFGTLDSEDED